MSVATTRLSFAAIVPSTRLHPGAWAAWFAAVAVMVLLISNPLYHALIAICALIVYASVRPPGGSGLDALLVGGWALASLTIPLNLITGSSGATEIIELPSATLPGWLGSVTFGGAVTAESLLYATSDALAIGALVSAICAFNAGVDHFQLLRITPPGLAQLGVVVTVGLLLIPETRARAASLREARLTRGQPAGWSSLIPLAIPLLSDAMERAVQRAESLDARGFGALATRGGTAEAIGAIAGLTLAAMGAFGWYYYEDARALAAAALASGGALVGLVAWRQASRGTARRMFVPAFGARDAVVAAGAIAGVGAVVLMRATGIGDISYLPFPELHAPEFSLLAAGAIALILPPMLQGPRA